MFSEVKKGWKLTAGWSMKKKIVRATLQVLRKSALQRLAANHLGSGLEQYRRKGRGRIITTSENQINKGATEYSYLLFKGSRASPKDGAS